MADEINISLGSPTPIGIELGSPQGIGIEYSGVTGPAGPPGSDGADGTNGADGVDGTDGTNGTNGADGKSGIGAITVPTATFTAEDDMASGYSSEYVTGTVSHDSSVFKEGVGSIKLILPSNGDAAGMSKSGLALNLAQSNFRLWLRSTDWDNVAVAQIQFRVDDSNYFFLDLKQYFLDLTTNDEWFECVFTRQRFSVQGTPSWAAISKVLVRAWSQNGVAPTVWFDGLGIFNQGKKGVVSVVFDDGWVSQFTKAQPYLDKYGLAGGVFIIPSLLGNSGYMTADQIDLLHGKNWDVSGHGETDLTSLSENAADADLASVSTYLHDRGYRGAALYAYPNGQDNDAVRKLVQKYFGAARTINYVNGSTSHVLPLRINAFSPIDSTPVATIQGYIDSAIANNEWLVLTFHKIADTTTVSTEYSTANYQSVIDYIHASGIEVQPMSRILSRDWTLGDRDVSYFRQVGTSRVERWYIAGQISALAMATATPSANTAYAVPFVPQKDVVIDRLGVQVTSFGASCKARLGIYDNTSDTDLYPANLLVDSGELDLGSNGMKSATISQKLKAGQLYWFVYNASTTASQVRALAVGGAMPIFGSDNALATAIGNGWSVSRTYGALPATYPASGTVFTNTPPAIGFRLSS